MRVVSLLARAQLEALQRAERLLFAGASEELQGLIELCGLTEVLTSPSNEAGPGRTGDQE